jgi:RNA polymerase sigma-70 factor (ECF subfamily)
MADDFDAAEDNEATSVLCECFRSLLPSLNPDYAEIIEVLDLQDAPTTVTAERLQLSPSALKVKRHRARQALKRRLEETCRVCAQHHCLDCTCKRD